MPLAAVARALPDSVLPDAAWPHPALDEQKIIACSRLAAHHRSAAHGDAASFLSLGGLAKGFAKGLLGGGGKEPPPESSTAAVEGQAGIPAKPQKKLLPPPGHPLFMQPPAVRAAVYSNLAKRKMAEAQMHAESAQKEAAIAEDEWRKSDGFATESAANRDAVVKYQLHDSMVKSLNRLLAFGARSDAMYEAGQAPLGGEPPEVGIASTMVLQTRRRLDDINSDIKHLEGLIEKYKDKEGMAKVIPDIEAKGLRKLTEQRDLVQEIYEDLTKSEAILKEQVPKLPEPPFVPKTLLRPDGEPWWPAKPPNTEVAHRLMLVKAYNPSEDVNGFRQAVRELNRAAAQSSSVQNAPQADVADVKPESGKVGDLQWPHGPEANERAEIALSKDKTSRFWRLKGEADDKAAVAAAAVQQASSAPVMASAFLVPEREQRHGHDLRWFL